MNIQEYISSGIIERYVLGLASAEEQREFEQLCAQYPELATARTAFETALEQQAFEHALPPPAELKEKILRQTKETGKIIPIEIAPGKKPGSPGWLKYAAAACLVLLAGSLYWNITLYRKNRGLQNRYEEAVAKLDDMNNDVRVLRQNPNVKMASMKGMPISPASFATVFWDTTTHDVYLLVNNLPVPASDKQYQLWALLNGQPVDLGVFDIKKEKLLIQAKNTQGAEAFAITLENKGGSPRPTMEKLYVMGKL